MLPVFGSVPRIIDCLEKTSIEDLKKIETILNEESRFLESEIYLKFFLQIGSYDPFIKSEKEITNKKKNLIEKFNYLQKIYFDNLLKIASTYFTNAFKWFIAEAKWDPAQGDLYRKKFIQNEHKLISATLDSSIKENEINHFIKIIGGYTIEKMKINVTSKVLSESIDELHMVTKIFGDKSEKELKLFYKELKKLYPAFTYEYFKSIIEESKEFRDPEKNKEYKDLEKFKLQIDSTRQEIFSSNDKIINADYNKIKTVEEALIYRMFYNIKPSDTIYIALIHALNNYKIILETEKKKKYKTLEGVITTIQFVNYDVSIFVDYLITKKCFLEVDKQNLLKVFSGEASDKKIIFQLNINVLGTIFYKLNENKKIQNSKRFIERWLISTIQEKNSKQISQTSLHKILFKKNKNESGRVKRGSLNYHVILDLPLK